MRTTPASRIDYAALANFRYELRRFLGASEAAVRAAGLEPQQHQLLLALRGAPEGAAPTIAWLAERLQLRHHSTVGLVNRLVARRLVRRHRDPADRRRVLVELTAAGARVLRQLSLFHREEIRTRAPALVRAMAAVIGPRARLPARLRAR